MRTCGYKILIILLWLTVPVATAYLARADYDRYIEEGAIQRADCEARADVAARYAVLYSLHAETVLQLDTEDSLRTWNHDWRNLTRQYGTERRTMRPATPTHYPRADQELNQLEDQLASEQEQIDLAATRQEQYLRAEDGLLSMSQAVAEVEMAAQYYKNIHAEGIYLLLMEDLAKLEDRFHQLQQHRRQLYHDATAAQREARQAANAIQLALSHLPGKLAQDEQTTYYEALRWRLDRFDPWIELRAAVAGQAKL